MNSTFLNYLPTFIRSRIEGRLNLQKIIFNIGWLFFDKILRMGVGLFVVTWIARYLGPQQYGLWNYAIALTSLLSAFASLGLDSIVVRDIVREPEKKDEILGSAFVLKLLGSIFTVILSLVLVSFINPGETLTFWLVFISSAGFIAQSFNVIDFYFQSKILSKYTVISANSAFLIMAVVKVGLILLKAPLLAFAIAGLIEICLTSLFFVIAYHHNRENIFRWKFHSVTAKSLLKDSWPLILTFLAVMIYERIDQVMIGKMLGNTEVGLYSAAVRICDVWYFVPSAILISIFPSLVEIKKSNKTLYYARLQKIFGLMVWLGIGVALIFTFTSDFIVDILLGNSYNQSSIVLTIRIWGGIFAVLGGASQYWIINEGLLKYSFYRALSGCIVNVILNFVFIPKYGINGAAIATVISYSVAAFFFDITNQKTRAIFFMKIKAFNPIMIFK